MALRTVRLELARSHEFPEGSARHGYEFTAPLDENGRFDAAEWKTARAKCKVRRFWGDRPDESGELIHTRGRRWAFSYVPRSDEDDEPIFKFDRHTFNPGDYVSITEHDGVQRTFRVAAVR
jgi:hypothetical protein